jgi:uncharacterized membrane protein
MTVRRPEGLRGTAAARDTTSRSTVIRHALLSYMFGAIILGTAINLVAGLGAGGALGR